jgi:hypothetical protein
MERRGSASGLKVRPFSVITPTGRAGTGDCNGKALSGRFAVNCRIEVARRVTKRPVASMRWCSGIENETTLACGGCRPAARICSAM